MKALHYAGVLAGIVAFWTCGNATSQTTTVFKLNIPSQTLDDAVHELGRQSGLQIFLASDEGKGVTTPRVSGEFTVDGALSLLLSATDLNYRYIDARTISIRAKPAPAKASEPQRGAAPIKSTQVFNHSTYSPILLAQAETSNPQPSSSSAARTNSPAAPNRPKDEELLGEVIVSALKRDQNLIDVPMSVGVITNSTLTNIGPVTLEDVDSQVANLNITKRADSFTAVNIRGVGSNSRNISFDTRIGVYVDGVYLGGNSPSTNVGFLDVERVEVLRGPQDTLFGKNNIAGAISIITRQPSFDETEGSLKVGAGNLEERELEAIGNIPIGERSALRIAGRYEEQGDYVENLTGHDIGGYRSKTVLAKFRSRLTDNLELTLAGDGQFADRRSYWSQEITNTTGNIINPFHPRPLQTALNSIPFHHRQIWGIAAHLNYTGFETASILSTTAYRRTDSRDFSDVDYSPLDILETDYVENREQFSQEFQFNFKPMAQLDVIAGVFYIDMRSTTNRHAPLGTDAGLFGASPDASLDHAGEGTSKGFAVYAEGTYAFTDQLTGSLGARWSQDKKDIDWAINAPVFGLATASLKDDRTDEYPSFSASLRYEPRPQINFYARVATGFKSGGWNLDYINAAQVAAGLRFDKETVKSYELGAKGLLFDGAMSYSLAIFQSIFSDYQIDRSVPTGPSTSVFTLRNAAEVKTEGAELQITARPVDDLTLTATLGLLDPKFDSFPGGLADGGDASGKRLPFAAETTFSGSIDYRIPLNTATGTNLRLNAEAVYVGDMYETPDNIRSSFLNGSTTQTVPNGYMPSHTLINARISFDTSETWNISAWARNLTDKRYLVSAPKDFFGGYQLAYGYPRLYGLTVTTRF